MPKFEPPWGGHLSVLAGPGGFLDTALGFVLLAGDALGVDPQQNVHAVASPLGNLGRGNPGVQPGGNRRMPQIVRAPGQQ